MLNRTSSSAGPNSGERHIAVLAHRIPYPPDKGDKIRSFHFVQHLAASGWVVHLCALADEPADLDYVQELRKLCATVSVRPLSTLRKRLWSLQGPLRGLPLSVPYFYEPALQRDFDAVLGRHRPEAVLCICAPMAEYVFRSKELSARSGQRSALRAPGRRGRPSIPASQHPGDTPRLVIDFMDVDSDKWEQYAEWSRPPKSWVYRTEARLLSRYERKIAGSFDATLLVSPAEADVLRRRTGLTSNIYAVGNGVDLEYFHPADGSGPWPEVSDQPRLGPAEGAVLSRFQDFQHPSRQAKVHRLVFCGAMDYVPNVDAVTWFAREVFPLLRERIGSVVFTIVGSNPADDVRRLTAIPGVTVTGRVEDVRPYVWDADVSVAPIRIARGVQNKVLEAMAMGKAVVATPEAFEGIQALQGVHLLVSPAEPESFARGVGELLLDAGWRTGMGAAARGAMEGTYHWSDPMIQLEAILADR